METNVHTDLAPNKVPKGYLDSNKLPHTVSLSLA